MASFQAGDFDFILLSAHIRRGAEEDDRLKELALLAEWADERVKEKHGWDQDIISLGRLQHSIARFPALRRDLEQGPEDGRGDCPARPGVEPGKKQALRPVWVQLKTDTDAAHWDEIIAKINKT
jgi:hypothetical protein